MLTVCGPSAFRVTKESPSVLERFHGAKVQLKSLVLQLVDTSSI